MAKNPFDEEPLAPRRPNPFPDATYGDSLEDSLGRIEHAARTVRRLKSQLGAEGLTLSATREMIDELSLAMEATVRAIRDIDRRLA